VDVLATLDGIDGVSYSSAPEGTYEHVDLTFDNGGPFDPATYGGDAEKARKVREAFLKTIPRQEIIEKLIQPLQEDATTRDSFLIVPGAPSYDEVVANNGSDAWADVDIEGAKALLAEAGVTTPVDVRFLYGKSNVRRANEFQLISASASQAGFNVIDNGDDNWGTILGTGTYDASLFGWQSTNTFILNAEANYVTGGQNNYGGYSNPEVDALLQEANAADTFEESSEGYVKVQERILEDFPTVPLFGNRYLYVTSDRISELSTVSGSVDLNKVVTSAAS
jgi:peptide/nickel transport system substrate-binding protein